jgi:hypothetical protein
MTDPRNFAFHREPTVLLKPFFHLTDRDALTKGITEDRDVAVI